MSKEDSFGDLFSVCDQKWPDTELLTHRYKPYKYVMTYKYSQDHLELMFNKICGHCGCNNNPDVLEFKYALRRLLIRNSKEASKQAGVQALIIPFVIQLTSLRFHARGKKVVLLRKV